MSAAALYVAWAACFVFLHFSKATLVTRTLTPSTTPITRNLEPAHSYRAIAHLGNAPSTTFDVHARSATQFPAPTTSTLTRPLRPAHIVNQSTLITEFDPYICGMFRKSDDSEYTSETLFGKSKPD
jgi:hypothetical protein